MKSYSFKKNKTHVQVTNGVFYHHKIPKNVANNVIGSFDTKFNIEGYDIFELPKGDIKWLRSQGLDSANIYGFVTHFDQEGMVKIDWNKLTVRFLETTKFEFEWSRPTRMTALRLELDYDYLID